MGNAPSIPAAPALTTPIVSTSAVGLSSSLLASHTVSTSAARLSSSRVPALATTTSVSSLRESTVTQISVSTDLILSTIIQNSTILQASTITQIEPAAMQPQATVTQISTDLILSTIIQSSTLLQPSTITQLAPAAVQPQATVTVEITETPSAASSASTAALASATVSMTSNGAKAGTNTDGEEPPTTSSPGLQGAGVSTPSSPPTITQPKRGPFSPVAAVLGGIPNKNVDVPVTAVFLGLFVIGAASHFIRHEINSKRGHKFVISDMIFDFCMVRNVTCIMRIVWAFRPQNNSIVLAASIFENAGVVVLFAVNVVFAQRILRATHPRFGWHPIISNFFFIILVSVPMIIVWNIVNLTISFFTLNEKSLRLTKDLLLFGSCWTLFLSVFPAFWVSLATAIPSKSPVEKFGSGRFRMKPIVLMLATAMLVVGAITRLLGAVLERPIDQPSHLFSKPVFYTTGFMLEIIVVYFYLFIRVDLRFWVPDGCKGPGDYKVKQDTKSDSDEESLVRDDIDEKSIASSSIYDGPRSTEAQVRAAVAEINLNNGGDIVGTPIDSGNSEVLLYAFKVQKQTKEDENFPRRPPRSSTWMGKSRVNDIPPSQQYM